MYGALAFILSTAYDSYKRRHVYYSKQYLEKSQWMKKEDIERLQIKRFKTLLTYAYENVPYYNKAFRQIGFRPPDFHTLKDLCRIPILKKQEVRKNLGKLTASNASGRSLVWETSGTTASPISILRGREDVGWGVAAELRGYSWAGYKPGDKLALVWNIRPKLERSTEFRIKNILRRCKTLNIRRLSERSLESFAERLHRFQPDFIRGHSGSLNLFATFLQRHNRFNIRPRAALTCCETLLPHYRRTIEGMFNCKAYDQYASNETSHIAAQCGCSRGLHVTEENVLLEIVKDDEHASPGEEGKILLTSLTNFAMPFIRYDIGDMGKVLPEVCSCGRRLSLLEILGRTNEYFVKSDGSFVFLKDFQRFFEGMPIQDFEVVQENLDEIVIKIVPRIGYATRHTDFIVQNMRFVGSAKIRVELVESIIPHESGKMKHIISKIATRYT